MVRSMLNLKSSDSRLMKSMATESLYASGTRRGYKRPVDAMVEDLLCIQHAEQLEI